MFTYRHYARSLLSSAAALAILVRGAPPALAQSAAAVGEAAATPAGHDSEAPRNNGFDFTRPENSLEFRFRDQTSEGTDTQTGRERGYVRLTSRIELDDDWKLAWLAQGQLLGKTVVSPDPSKQENAFGLGDSIFQAALIRTLSDRWAFGFGARLLVPTAQDDLGSGKWEIVPGFGVRYSIPEWGTNSYFVPQIRYAVSFAGAPSKRTISEPQIAPTLNISLPGRWFLTLYPSNDIRINYGDPVSGQTGRLFLPADFAVGYHLNDHVQMSLEIGVPIIRDYPVYDFKAEFRIVIKN
jgi:Putative MetA-pathway of phenol degradation